jgi:hypothetical protein
LVQTVDAAAAEYLPAAQSAQVEAIAFANDTIHANGGSRRRRVLAGKAVYAI